MRVLIIGGTSFIGPWVVRGLVERGHEITLFHRGKTEARLPSSVRHVLGDRQELASYADELRRIAPRVVVDMIPLTEQDANGVMEVFHRVAHRVIAISSQDVYRAYGRLIGIESGPLETGPLDEEAPLRQKRFPYRDRVGPDHRLYHYDKILVERVFMGDVTLPGTVLRLPMVYGPGDRQHRLFPYLKRMDDHRPAILLGQSMASWRWTKGYVEDVAAAILLAVTNERASGRIYNVGEALTLSEADWVKAIGAAAGWKGEVVALPEDALPRHLLPGIDTAQELVADTTRIRRELGYRGTVSREEALRRTVRWERANPPEVVDPKSFDYAAEDASLPQAT